MGLLDRVKANQSGGFGPEPASPYVPAAGPAAPAHLPPAEGAPVAGHGPALAVLPPVAPATPTRRPERPAARPSASEQPLPAHLLAVKRTIHARLLGKHAGEIDVADRDSVREKIVELVDEHIRGTGTPLVRTEKQRLTDALLDDICGLGPLQALIDDASVSEIMINQARQVYIERAGRLTLSEAQFDDDAHLMRVIDRIVSTVGRHVDEANPYVDARLADGSRVNVIIPPLALKGPAMTIRKFSVNRLGPDDLLGYRSATPDMLKFLGAAVRSRMNVLVSGGTGSGKTTLLNILSGYIPEEERVITCEDAAELQMQQPHVITLESRPANVEGSGEVSIRDLVRNCLRMRPDRMIVGECRGGEALDMLQAMNTGHDGSMSTVHANNPTEAMGRLETLVLMAGTELPSRAIREQIATAIHLVVQQQRLRGGARRIVSIAEITGLDEKTGSIKLQELFCFKQLGISAEGNAIGYHTATGARPRFLERFQESGEDLPAQLFEPVRNPSQGDLY